MGWFRRATGQRRPSDNLDPLWARVRRLEDGWRSAEHRLDLLERRAKSDAMREYRSRDRPNPIPTNDSRSPGDVDWRADTLIRGG